ADRGRTVVVVDGLAHAPACLWPLLEERADLSRKGRRGHRARQQPQAVALPFVELGVLLGHHSFHGGPGGWLAVLQWRLRPRRIVEPEQCGLHENVRGATARRMVRIAFELYRPTDIALAEHRLDVAGKEDRSGVPFRLAGDDELGRVDVG